MLFCYSGWWSRSRRREGAVVGARAKSWGLGFVKAEKENRRRWRWGGATDGRGGGLVVLELRDAMGVGVGELETHVLAWSLEGSGSSRSKEGIVGHDNKAGPQRGEKGGWWR